MSHRSKLALFVSLVGFLTTATAAPIDREALVKRHNPVVRSVDPSAPLTVGNGGFAFTVDVTGLQSFGDYYHKNGIPLETLARWCWVKDENTKGYTMADASRTYVQPDGKEITLPSKQSSPAGDFFRRNPRQHPLGQLSLEWIKPDGTAFVPADVQNPEQTLDLWRGTITSRYQLGGVPVTVVTVCDPDSDTIAIHLESDLAQRGQLRVRLAFPRGHDPKVKNTPGLDWTHPEEHRSTAVSPTEIDREVQGTRYRVTTSQPLQPAGPHAFRFTPSTRSVDLNVRFSSGEASPERHLIGDMRLAARSADYWGKFWKQGAAVDFAGSTNPLAQKLEERIVLSRYLTATQCAGDVPPQESGLTCNTWYGKHHTEMVWWHTAHFALWGEPAQTARNLDWFVSQLPTARALAKERGLSGARWAKMVGPDGIESPGGNPMIVWNQPHPIYLAELLRREDSGDAYFKKYQTLVAETAEAMITMLKLDPKRDRYVLGPPLWIAQEIHDQATSQNPAYELAYWRWAIEVAQRWRVQAGQSREKHWDDVLAKLSPLPIFEGKYTALESHPDTWTNPASRHDHPSFLMALGFLPGGPDVDRATMDRTLTAVLKEWDWEAKIWGWDYPMIAMTATRLGRPADAVEVLLRDGPNNRYTPNGHCPQGSDNVRKKQSEGRPEIAVYLPANGSFLAAVALMVGGWDGCKEEFPGFPKDGTWTIRAEGMQRSP